jgi:flagellar hook-length control protein FliK
MGDGTGGSTTGAIPADAMAETSALLSNLGPSLPTAPNSASAPVSPTVAASLASAQPLTGANPASTGAGDPGTGAGGEGRFRFAPAAAANDGSRATAAAALGAPGGTPALANTPSLASAPAAVVDSSEVPTVSAQVSAHVLGMVSGQSREMIMRLHPPELGEVTVRVAVSGRDVSAWFGSPHGQVQTAIAGGIGQLQAELGNAGYNLNGAWVGADASGARQQGANLSSPATSIAAATAVDPSGMAAASRPAASGLNIYV